MKLSGLAGAAALIAALAIAMFSMSGGASVTPVEAQITVLEVLNRVEADRPRATSAALGNFLPAVSGQDLAPGDGVKTFADSEVRVDIAVGDFVRVSRTKPNTLWSLGQFALDEGAVIELEQGTIFLFDDAGETDLRPIKIITPAGIASPRGTWMKIGYDPVTEEAELQCFRGTCVLENELGTHVLVDEQRSVGTTKLPPAKPVEMSVEESQEFVDLPEVASGEVVAPTPEPVSPESAKNVPITAPAVEPRADEKETTNPGPQVLVPDEPVDPSDSGTTTDKETPPEPVDPPAPPPTLAPEPSPTPSLRPTGTPKITPTPFPTRYPTPIPAPTPTPIPLATPTPVIGVLPPIDSSVLPHIFVGTAVLNGAPAPHGTVISAWMSGFSEPVAREIVSGDSFTILVSQYGAQPMNGKTVEFLLDGLPAEPTGTWVAGGADILVLEPGGY